MALDLTQPTAVDKPYFGPDHEKFIGAGVENVRRGFKPLLWMFKTENSEATLNTAGYWNDAASALREGDLISVTQVTDRGLSTETTIAHRFHRITSISNGNATSVTTSGFGGTDHGSLSGRDDDDHPQYTLADGTRAFTGAITGVTPTGGTHLTTKDYVDSLLGGVTAWRDPVIDKDLTAPPGGESTGDRYIVAATATGAWAGQEQNIAVYNGSGWDFTTPSQGWALIVTDESILYVYDTGNDWTSAGSPGTTDHGALSGLGDDDHSQYHNDARADTWLSSKGSDDLANNSTVSGSTVSDAIEQAAQSGPAGDGTVEREAREFVVKGGIVAGTGSFGALNRHTFTHGVQFNYPWSGHPEATIIADLWRSKGAVGYRIPLKWQDLQKQLNGALDSNNTAPLIDAVELALARGYDVMLDLHDYGRRYLETSGTTQYTIENDAPTLTKEHFADFVTKLMALFPTTTERYKRISLEIQNEPVHTAAEGMPVWGHAIDALRAAGSDHFIWVPGPTIQKMEVWISDGGAAQYLTMKAALTDDSNVGISFHQYFDNSNGGGGNDCWPMRDKHFVEVTAQWLRDNDEVAIIGEMGFGRPGPLGNNTYDTANTVLYYAPQWFEWLQANNDVFKEYYLWGTQFGWPEDDNLLMLPGGLATTWPVPPVLPYWVEKSICPYFGYGQSVHAGRELDLLHQKTENRILENSICFHDFTSGLWTPKFHKQIQKSGGFTGLNVKEDAAEGGTTGFGDYGLRFAQSSAQGSALICFIDLEIGANMQLARLAIEARIEIEDWVDPLSGSDQTWLLTFGKNDNYNDLARLVFAGNPAKLSASIVGGSTGTTGTLVSAIPSGYNTYRLEIDFTDGGRFAKVYLNGTLDDEVNDTGTGETITNCGFGFYSKAQATFAYDWIDVQRF